MSNSNKDQSLNDDENHSPKLSRENFVNIQNELKLSADQENNIPDLVDK